MVVSSPFLLDPQLAADTLPVGRFSLSLLLLLDDARYPWLVLVPEQAKREEIIDLPDADQQQLMLEIAAVSRALKRLYAPDKINVGALGNRVRQLHVHVLARFVSDAAWPGPVWGFGQSVPYPSHLAAMTVDRLFEALSSDGLQRIQS